MFGRTSPWLLGVSALALASAPRATQAAPAATLSMNKLVAGDNLAGAADGFGQAVSVSGDSVLVGAPGSAPSAVYTFGRSASGWAAEQKLVASDAAPSFGGAIATYGATALIGAEAALVGAEFPGAAYIFARVGSTWSERQRLIALDDAGKPIGKSGDAFGSSVSISGDVAVVGAPFADGWFGAAHVFVQSGGIWSQQQRLKAPDLGIAQEFGKGVAVSGDTIFVGAPFSGSGGSVYVFARAGSTWNFQQRFQPDDAHPYNDFGTHIALAGDTALVGPYVLVRSGSTWTQHTKLEVVDSVDLGDSVAISAAIALVGDRFATVGANDGQGALYLFTPSGGAWQAAPRVAAAHGMQNDWFAAAVSFSGTTFVVGAPSLGPAPGAAWIGTLSDVDAPPVVDAGAPPLADAGAAEAMDAGAPSDGGPAAETTGAAGAGAPASDAGAPSGHPGGHLAPPSGCSCSMTGQPASLTGPALGLLAAAAIALRRRRPRSRTAERTPGDVS
jgi:MYXO-CTERM domain-containing protein